MTKVTVDVKQDERIDDHADRLVRVEQAIIQINHFTESIEKIELPRWMGKMEGEIGWIKVLMGATTLATIGKILYDVFGPK